MPERRCVACRHMVEKTQLIRVSKQRGEGATDTFTLDPGGKAPGRGAYVCQSEVCLTKAMKTKGFDRSYRQKVNSEVYTALANWASHTLNIELTPPTTQ